MTLSLLTPQWPHHILWKDWSLVQLYAIRFGHAMVPWFQYWVVNWYIVWVCVTLSLCELSFLRCVFDCVWVWLGVSVWIYGVHTHGRGHHHRVTVTFTAMTHYTTLHPYHSHTPHLIHMLVAYYVLGGALYGDMYGSMHVESGVDFLEWCSQGQFEKWVF